MATVLARASSPPSRPLAGLVDLFTEELAPYEGRTSLVARMTIAATIVMVVSMTFQIPLPLQSAIFVLFISRESPRATLRAVATLVVVFALTAVYILIGAMASLGDPMLRLVWVIGTLFLMFFALSTMTDYVASTGFGILVTVTLPIWDLPIPPELKVERTLWAAGQTVLAGVVTALVELAFAAWRRDDLVTSLAMRLLAVEELLTCLADGRSIEAVGKKLAHFGLVGTSRLRRVLRRSTRPLREAEPMGAVLALVGRLVDIAANMASLGIQSAEDDRARARRLGARIAGIRTDLVSGRVPRQDGVDVDGGPMSAVPLIRELETTVSLIPEAYTGSRSHDVYALPPGDPSPGVFVPDALSNPRHIQVALKGCLAASLCYVTYMAVAWPGISTSVVTCLLTAMTTIGASRQKQALRVSGAILGGIVATGAQVFILPSVDSIGGFMLLFVAVTSAASWIATSGPRLSYLGIQFALAFYVVHLQEFALQTSLAVARDRVAGVLLGLFAMWLVFDQLWSVPAAVAMRREFVSTLRQLAELAREPLSQDHGAAAERSYALRETINQSFDGTRALADGVLFEFGASRLEGLAWRRRILAWQPSLRLLFVMRTALLKYRFGLPGFELPPAVASAQEAFDRSMAARLDRMADRLAVNEAADDGMVDGALAHLEEELLAHRPEAPGDPWSPHLQTFLTLCRRTEELTAVLESDVGR